MFDLLAAGDSRRDDFYVGTGRLDCRGEAAVADSQRQIVVLFLEAEGARHAAASRINLLTSNPADFKTATVGAVPTSAL